MRSPSKLGVVAKPWKDFTCAHDEYEQALQLRPDYAIAHTNLGRIYEDLKEVDHAYAQYQLAVKTSSDGAAAAYQPSPLANFARIQ